MKKLLLLFTLFFYNLIIGQSIISVSPNDANRGQSLEITIKTKDIDYSVTTPTVNASFADQFGNILLANDKGYFYTANEIKAYFSIPGYAIPGLYSVNLVEENGVFNMTLADAFTVKNAYTFSIQGNIRYDSNSNGCDASDINLQNQKLTFTNGTKTGKLIADKTGFYNYYDVLAGNNSFSPIMENPSYFTISPPSSSVNLSTTNNLFIQDFCISPNGVHNDLEVSLQPITSARPGFDAIYKITYKNKGTSSQNGIINFNFDDNVMDLIKSTPVINTQGSNSLSWNFSNLLPFETREILVTMNINSPSEFPPVNNGNILTFNATINGAVDETIADNTSALNQTVVGSYDPNDKTCVEGSLISPQMVGKYLHYVIRFENKGTANAENVVVSDLIDTTKFDINSLIPLSSSHSFITKITNTNLVDFIFENINLPFDDANNDGYITFKIKTKPTLVIGDMITNKADIFFDYNLPITTEPYTTIVSNTTLTKTTFKFDDLFILSPVPVKNTLTVTTKETIKIIALNIYNVLGQLVVSSKNSFQNIDVSNLKTGSYSIKITSNKGTTSSKFVKE